jgi:hypothetical protein
VKRKVFATEPVDSTLLWIASIAKPILPASKRIGFISQWLDTKPVSIVSTSEQNELALALDCYEPEKTHDQRIHINSTAKKPRI